MLLPAWKSRRAALAGPLALGALLCAGALKADDAAESVSLEYRADATCPTEADFVRLVRDKTQKFRVGPSVPGQRTFRVLIEGDHPSRGELSIVGGLVPEARRAVEGDSCAEVVSALALATALAVDPPAPDAALSERGESMPSPPQPAASSSSPSKSDLPPRLPTPAVPQPVERAGEASSSWAWGVGAYGAAAFGVAPNPLVGGGLALELLDQPRHPGIIYRVGIELEDSKAVEAGSAQVGFSRALVRVGICPFSRAAGRVDAFACGHLAAGLLFGHSGGVPGARTDTGFWSSGGASLLLTLQLGRSFSLAVDGGLDAAFRRDRYFLRPDDEFHRVPAVAGLASVGLFGILP